MQDKNWGAWGLSDHELGACMTGVRLMAMAVSAE